jgi:hypothetical protein
MKTLKKCSNKVNTFLIIIGVIFTIYGIVYPIWQNLISYIFGAIGLIISIYSLMQIETVKSAISNEKKKKLLLDAIKKIDELLRAFITIENENYKNGDNDGDKNIMFDIRIKKEEILKNCSEIENYNLISGLSYELGNFNIEYEPFRETTRTKLRNVRNKIDKCIKEMEGEI